MKVSSSREIFEQFSNSFKLDSTEVELTDAWTCMNWAHTYTRSTFPKCTGALFKVYLTWLCKPGFILNLMLPILFSLLWSWLHPSNFALILTHNLCYSGSFSLFSHVKTLGACIFFVAKHFGIKFLYERCFRPTNKVHYYHYYFSQCNQIHFSAGAKMKRPWDQTY